MKMTQIEEIIRTSLKSETPFKELCRCISNIKCNTTADLKTKKQQIGDLWEDFSCKYLIVMTNLF